MANIAWFKEISKNDIGLVGGKGLNLGIMYNLGLPVPPGFVVTAQAYKDFLIETALYDDILELLQGLDVEDTQKLEETAQHIQDMIIAEEMPEQIKKDIVEAYKNLDINTDVFKSVSKIALDIIKAGRDKPYVAVRSSATAEDLPQASFAGQQATFINVKGNKEVVAAVQQCWASLFTARAIYYRVKNNFPHEKVLIAVVVQRMINSEAAGVVFTANPSTNNTDEIMIEAAFGFGDAVVAGLVNPDNYIVDKETLNIKHKKINKKDFMFIRDYVLNKTVKKPLSEEKANKQVLSEEQIKKLAELAKKIESHYKNPQDIEFAVEENRLYIVQTRSITTLHKKEEEHEEISEESILEGLAASPGIASGPVKIVHEIKDLYKIKQGDILVTKMTNPDFVVAMEKASAIVTDQGGSTSHAAIVSRELQIPCVVGTEKATEILNENDIITVDGTNGKVYRGKIEIKHEEEKQVSYTRGEIETTAEIKVISDLPGHAERAAMTGADGVGLVRLEFMIAEGGVHPAKYIRDNREEEYIELLVKGISGIAKAFSGKPVWVRTSDIRTDEYRNLEGGDEEPTETDPMIGWHGIRRGLDEIGILKAEFEAIKRVHDMGYSNVGIMLPFLINVDELIKSKDIMREVGLEPLKDIEFGVMIETPASCWIIDELCKEGISFISFGTNDLTQLTLGIDRNNERIQKLFSELHPAVLGEIKKVVKTCQKYNVKTSICGQAGSNTKMAEFLVSIGIDSISANPDAVQLIRQVVAKAEKKLILKAARKFNE